MKTPILAKYGGAEIRQDGDWKCLYHNGRLWVVDIENEWYEKYLYPHVRGRVLEFGLGMGVSSKGILALPDCNALFTVEREADIIELFQQENTQSARHCIFHSPQLEVFHKLQGMKFDTVFIDTWTAVDREAVRTAAQIHRMLREGNHLNEGAKVIPWFGDYMDKFIECGENYQEFRKVVPE